MQNYSIRVYRCISKKSRAKMKSIFARLLLFFTAYHSSSSGKYSPYPCASISSFGTNRREALLMQ